MKALNFKRTLLTDQSPEEVFQAVNNVGDWWSEIWSGEVKGQTKKLHDEFVFTAADGAHYSKQKLVEVIPNKKVVWLVTASKLTFLKKMDEWTGTRMIFEIVKKGDETQLTFTHEGLTPDSECYNDCAPGWTAYLDNKLFPLISASKVY